MKAPLIALAVLFASAAMAEGTYGLRIDSSVHDGKLTIVPYAAAPAGSRLRYEMVSGKEGGAGKSSTRQSGTVQVGESGSARLAILSLGVNPQDRYTVTVKLFDGRTLVAEDKLEYPH